MTQIKTVVRQFKAHGVCIAPKYQPTCARDTIEGLEFEPTVTIESTDWELENRQVEYVAFTEELVNIEINDGIPGLEVSVGSETIICHRKANLNVKIIETRNSIEDEIKDKVEKAKDEEGEDLNPVLGIDIEISLAL